MYAMCVKRLVQADAQLSGEHLRIFETDLMCAHLGMVVFRFYRPAQHIVSIDYCCSCQGQLEPLRPPHLQPTLSDGLPLPLVSASVDRRQERTRRTVKPNWAQRIYFDEIEHQIAAANLFASSTSRRVNSASRPR